MKKDKGKGKTSESPHHEEAIRLAPNQKAISALEALLQNSGYSSTRKREGGKLKSEDRGVRGRRKKI